MKVSELAEKLRPLIKKMVREEIQAAVKDQLQETVMRSIGEVYIRTLVEEVTARKGRINEAYVDDVDDEPVVETRRPASKAEALRRKQEEAKQRAQMAQMVARNQQVATPAVLSKDNPLRDLYEGVSPIEEEATTPSIPLEAMPGLDLARMQRLNKRLIED